MHVWKQRTQSVMTHDYIGPYVKTTSYYLTDINVPSFEHDINTLFWYIFPFKGGRWVLGQGGIKETQWKYIASIKAKVSRDIENGDWSYCFKCWLEWQIPGKLRARPVQHPATPALITAQGKKHDIWCKWGMNNRKYQFRIPYHHPFLAASSKCRQPNCALQTKLQMSEEGKHIKEP